MSPVVVQSAKQENLEGEFRWNVVVFAFVAFFVAVVVGDVFVAFVAIVVAVVAFVVSVVFAVLVAVVVCVLFGDVCVFVDDVVGDV